jgi:hypothetical protein
MAVFSVIRGAKRTRTMHKTDYGDRRTQLMAGKKTISTGKERTINLAKGAIIINKLYMNNIIE